MQGLGGLLGDVLLNKNSLKTLEKQKQKNGWFAENDKIPRTWRCNFYKKKRVKYVLGLYMLIGLLLNETRLFFTMPGSL